MRVLPYMTGENFSYRLYHAHRALIYHPAWPKMVDAPLTLSFKVGQGACHCLFCLSRWPILWLCITTRKSIFNYRTDKTKNHWRSIDANCLEIIAMWELAFLPIKAANTFSMHWNNQVSDQSPDLQVQKFLTLHWHSSSGWRWECVSLVVDYNGSQFINKVQWRTKVNILQLAVGYLNATVHRKTCKLRPEIETDGLCQSWQNWVVGRYASGEGQPSSCRLGFWTGVDLNRTVLAIQTRTAGRLPWPVDDTMTGQFTHRWYIYGRTSWCQVSINIINHRYLGFVNHELIPIGNDIQWPSREYDCLNEPFCHPKVPI